MAEIVETDFFQSVVFQYNLKMLCDEVWFDKFAHCIYIDIIQIFFAVGCSAYLLIDNIDTDNSNRKAPMAMHTLLTDSFSAFICHRPQSTYSPCHKPF